MIRLLTRWACPRRALHFGWGQPLTHSWGRWDAATLATMRRAYPVLADPFGPPLAP